MAVKKALITGITGQDGSYLAEYLLAKGYEVVGIIRRSSSFNTQRINHIFQDPHERNLKLRLVYGDLNDASTIQKIVAEYLPDEVYNLASQSHVRVSFDLPEYTGEITALGTLRILEAIKNAKEKFGKEIRFYQASSSELFGKTEPPQSEKTPFYPRSPYACSKLYAYWITKNYREAYNLFACNGILFNHESPRRGETFVTRKITRAVARIKEGVQKELFLGNLDAKRDWGFAGDYVESMWMMLQHERPDDYVVAMGESHTVREFLEESFRIGGIEIVSNNKKGVEEVYIRKDTGEVVVRIDPHYYRPTEVDFLLGDPRKAREVLGWKPRVSFKELVVMMVEHDMQELRKELYGTKNGNMGMEQKIGARDNQWIKNNNPMEIKMDLPGTKNEESEKKMEIKLMHDSFTEEEKDAVLNCLKSGQYTQGKVVSEFEQKFAAWVGAKHAVMVNSGSSANLLMAFLLKERYGLHDGDEVLVPAVTWPTTVYPLMQHNLRPVFCDVDETFNISFDSIKRMTGPKTRALFLVHLLGQPAEMSNIVRFCNERGILLIEDCCESLGARYLNIHVGNFGAMGSFSFYFGHHMSTIEGGMIITNDETTCDLLRSARSHGFVRGSMRVEKYKEHLPIINFLFDMQGYNVRSTNLNAAIGLVQLNKLDLSIATRKNNHKIFQSLLEAEKRITLQKVNLSETSSFSLGLLLNSKEMRDYILKHLPEKGIECRPIVAGNLLQQPVFIKARGTHREDVCTFADSIHHQGLYLPNNQFINEEKVRYLADTLVAMLNNQPQTWPSQMERGYG